MPASIVDDLLDMMPDTLIAQPGNLDAFGGFTASGESVSIPCYIEGEVKLVRDMSGRESVSSVQVYTGGVFSLTTTNHRYTLPARFLPREDLQAISIDRASDENGAHHEVVMFP